MKIRKEISGLHLFDRTNGLHILIDELVVPLNEIDISPRTVSIALTNVCELKCHFCYAPKSNDFISFQDLKIIAKKLDGIGVLELTFGGGEPLLHPYFVDICNWVWENTNLGITVTTNGHLINIDMVSKIKGKISFIRISIDGIEPYYSTVKGKPLNNVLENIKLFKNNIPFGINTVVSPEKTEELINVIELSIHIGAKNLMIIPEHVKGRFILTKNDWTAIEQIIMHYKNQIQLYLSYNASRFVHTEYLETEKENEYLFAHISAKKRLQINSYVDEGIDIDDYSKMVYYFKELYKNY